MTVIGQICISVLGYGIAVILCSLFIKKTRALSPLLFQSTTNIKCVRLCWSVVAPSDKMSAPSFSSLILYISEINTIKLLLLWQLLRLLLL